MDIFHKLYEDHIDEQYVYRMERDKVLESCRPDYDRPPYRQQTKESSGSGCCSILVKAAIVLLLFFFIVLLAEFASNTKKF